MVREPLVCKAAPVLPSHAKRLSGLGVIYHDDNLHNHQYRIDVKNRVGRWRTSKTTNKIKHLHRYSPNISELSRDG